MDFNDHGLFCCVNSALEQELQTRPAIAIASINTTRNLSVQVKPRFQSADADFALRLRDDRDRFYQNPTASWV
jgi:hypothetical protein